MKRRGGFTLIEILISLSIMATLGVLTARAITQGVKSKKRIQEQIDDVSKLRDSTKLMERDINLAVHFQDWENEIDLLVKKKSTTTPTTPAGAAAPGTPGNLGSLLPPDPLNNPNTPESEKREAAREDPTTFFVGTDSSVDFVTTNNTRMSRELKQADFLEVGYTVKDCKSADGKTSSKCLWRRTATFVDDDPTKGGEEMVLLENVTEFGLKYIGPGKQDWVKDWNSKTATEESIKNKFPSAVEISLTIEKKGEEKKAKKYSMQIVAAIHFTNNRDKNDSASPPISGSNPGVGP